MSGFVQKTSIFVHKMMFVLIFKAIGNSISSDQKEFIDCINRQPTVFDVDEVVQRLEMLIENKVSESGDDWYTAQCLNEAVEIVKGGGN